jgi:hypothetical protein
LSSADSRSCHVGGFRECFWVYFLILNIGLHFHRSVGFCFICIIVNLQFLIKSWFVDNFFTNFYITRAFIINIYNFLKSSSVVMLLVKFRGTAKRVTNMLGPADYRLRQTHRLFRDFTSSCW